SRAQHCKVNNSDSKLPNNRLPPPCKISNLAKLKRLDREILQSNPTCAIFPCKSFKCLWAVVRFKCHNSLDMRSKVKLLDLIIWALLISNIKVNLEHITHSRQDRAIC